MQIKTDFTVRWSIIWFFAIVQILKDNRWFQKYLFTLYTISSLDKCTCVNKYFWTQRWSKGEFFALYGEILIKFAL